MKILFFKQLFNPEPTAKSLDFALELKRRGHEVQVLTGFPSYPIGKIYEGYKQRLWRRENIEGIEIIRVPIYPDQSANGLKRSLHYISYAISASILGLFLVRKPDVAFVYQGAIPVGIPAILYKWLRNVPFLYDINDLWPESVAVSGMMTSTRKLKFIEAWCNLNYSQASKISVATPGFKRILIQKGVPESKLLFVPNWSRDQIVEGALPGTTRERYFPSEYFNILYAGNLGVVQGLDVFLRAAKYFDEKGLKVKFILLGAGADEERLKSVAESLNISNLEFVGRVPGTEVGKYLKCANALFVHLKDDPLFQITIPSKILSYLRVGKPILLGLRGDAAELITKSKSGLLFNPDDADDLILKIEMLLAMSGSEREELGKRGIRFYDENLSIESSTDKLETAFFEIINQQ